MMTHKKKKIVRKPSEVYQICPACKCKELIRLEVDVLCAECDWMSCEEYVEMGGMDNLFSAYRDHFAIDSQEKVADLLEESMAQGKIESALPEPVSEEELFAAEVSA